MTSVSTQSISSFDAIVAWARRQPASALAAVLLFHLVVWTAVPILVCRNLQLDLAEGLALGKEWQLGYWKHPPLPWWIEDLAYRLLGDVRVVYVLGPLAAVLTMYVVWRFAREIVPPLTAIVAAVSLEGLHYYNFSVPKFGHDHVIMVLWPLTAWVLYRALVHRRLVDWVFAGALMALCFWAKYTAFVFGATLGLFFLFDREARNAWATPGPYLMAVAFLVVLSPHLWWLVASDFQPFRYVEARAAVATRWYHYVTFPIQWTGGQLLAMAPALALLAILIWRRGRPMERVPDANAFARRFVSVLAFGPFVITTLIALVLGRLPIAMWGFPLWSFAPLAVLMWWPPREQRFGSFVRVLLVIIVAWPLIYAGVELFEPFLRDRPKATQFPGRLLAETITRQWHEKTGRPLRYVGGAEVGTGPGEFAANNIAVYSPDRPHVIVHGNPVLSPWADMADVDRQGVVLVWQPAPGVTDLPANIRTTFPRAELQPPLVLPRRALHPVRPEIIGYAFVPPRP